MIGSGQVLKVQGREIRVNNLDKVLVPAAGLRKADIIDYYIRVARFLLPHIEQRPLTLKMFIDGVGHPVRYLKNAPSYTPGWVQTAQVARKHGGKDIKFVLVNDLASLVWTVALSNIEMHTFLARSPDVHRPTMMVFDLDPGLPATVLEAAPLALELRRELTRLRLKSFVKSSGSKGLHVVIPLNTPVTYSDTEEFARALAEKFEAQYPDRVTTDMAKLARRGKIFVDYSQNAAHKSTACVYSMRGTERGAFVSMPLDWQMLENRTGTNAFFPTPEEALATLEHFGDLFAPVLKLRQRLPKPTRI
jgi:bifunctional non-homologous end joining protein LigD